MKKVLLLFFVIWVTSCGGPDLENAVQIAKKMKNIYKEGGCTQYRKPFLGDVEANCDSSLIIDSLFIQLFKNSPFSIATINNIEGPEFQFHFHSGPGSQEFLTDKTPPKLSSVHYTQINSTGWWHFKN